MTGGILIPLVILMSVNFPFSTYIFSADIAPEMLKLCRVTKVKVLFLVLTGGILIPLVILMSVNFSVFNLHFLS